MDLEACFKLMESPRPTSIPYMEEAIEQGGIRWDPRTGLEVGVVYVINRTHYSHPSFSRYSRRSRFFSRLLDYVTCDRMVSAIMDVFANILKAGKTKRHKYPRVYFLNVRCLLYLITKHLGIQAPFSKQDCLRDMKRFRHQENMFNDFV